MNLNSNSSTRVRAPDLFGLQPSSQMTNNHFHDEPASNLQTRRAASERRASCIQSFLKCKRTMKICTFNGQTLNQSHSLGELCTDAKQYNLTLTAIQEHRFYHTDNIRVQELNKDFTLITASAYKNTINATVGGVGFLINTQYVTAITNITKLSNRIIKIDFAGNPATTVLSCHSPHNKSSDQDIIEFYNNLSDAIEDIPAHNVLFLLGDFNAKIGPASAHFTYSNSTNKNWTYLLNLIENHHCK